jgi:hypothetical protein
MKYIGNVRPPSNTCLWKRTITKYTLEPTSEQIHLCHDCSFVIIFSLVSVYILSYSESRNWKTVVSILPRLRAG